MKRFLFGKRLAAVLALVFLLTLTPLSACAYNDLELTIFYSSDVHGYVVGEGAVIGIDRFAAMKEQTPNSILLDAGDFSMGKPIATLSQGADMFELMRLSGYAAAAIGNHEFDYGVDVLYDNINAERSGTAFISANVYKTDGERAFVPYVVERVGYVSIGIFGLTTLKTVSEAIPERISGIEMRDPVSEAVKAVGELKKLGCKIIVALTHLGVLEERPNTYDVANVAGIDVVIDGHSHVEAEIKSEKALIVSPGYYGTALGRLDITYNRDGGIKRITNDLIYADGFADISPSITVGKRLNEIVERQSEMLNRVIGYAPFDLDASFPDVRIKETTLGNLLADAIREIAGADFGISNGGGIRETISAGEVTMMNVLTTLPYSNLVLAKSVTGAQLYDILEHAYASLPNPAGKFAQISGLIVNVDVSKAPGERIVSLTKTDGVPIQKEARYTVALNEYIGSGGDSFPHLGSLPILFQGATEDLALIEYIINHDLSEYASTQNRIIIRNLP